jgi:hypothetical protein
MHSGPQNATALQQQTPPQSPAPPAVRANDENVSADLDRYREAWRYTLQTVKDTLADLEAASDKGSAEPASAVAGLVERLVAVATAAADAAGQHIRAEARAEVVRMQTTVEALRAELLREREQLKTLRQTLETERATRARAEKAAEEARGVRHQMVSEHEVDMQALRADLEAKGAEIVRLQQHIEGERTARQGLIAAMKQAVSIVEATNAPQAAAPAQPTSLQADVAGVTSNAAAALAAAEEPEPDPVPQFDPELVAYARELLGKTEAMYAADLAARKSASDLVDRLTTNLRRARLQFARRIGTTDLKDTTIFDVQLAEVLNTSEDTSFSRHLGIAAYESQSKSGA